MPPLSSPAIVLQRSSLPSLTAILCRMGVSNVSLSAGLVFVSAYSEEEKEDLSWEERKSILDLEGRDTATMSICVKMRPSRGNTMQP